MATAAALLLLLTLTLTHPAAAALAPSHPPSANPNPNPHTYTNTKPTFLSSILSRLGFHGLAAAAADANLSTAVQITIFAPTDSSLLTCPTCSRPVLLQEHSLPGIYPLHFLRTLAFGTKIESFAHNRCLTVTTSNAPAAAAARKVFINGIQITKPDLFNNGRLVVHAVQGFVSHLSPHSCNIELMTSLSFSPRPPPTAAFSVRRLMLKDAMTRLRISGYSIVALVMRVKYSDLADLDCLTLFAVDDESIFLDGAGGRAYLSDMGFHIVPNKLLKSTDLIALRKFTLLPTLNPGRNLVITTAGAGGPVSPLRINYVKVNRFDIVHNSRIIVHGMSRPFHDIGHVLK
ncbi:fasciclin-like arabinogalactan protein 21 [Andrographis paniculata]|uniref:fasciclin-like arabinogalactan protein 21 n=1 Tax=Andrographis paniculata TaxID=175694 RepID=UPI0021E96207|nr:fasciclin-like arabinogalactan protein 21 [Andrographis paniculata]